MSSQWEWDVREDLERLEAELAGLRAGQDLLARILTERGALDGGHEKVLGAIRQAAQVATRPRVRLAVLRDKYAVPAAEVDCRSLLPLCQARCCSFAVELSEQDLDEGGIRWDLQDPYLLRRADDRRCVHLDRASGGCTIHERRPAMCRAYDCRTDDRVWVDFEKRIPAPLRAGVAPLVPAAGDR